MAQSLYSYNGIVLPERPDTGAYSYHYIIQYSGVEGYDDSYLLLATDVEAMCYSDGIAFPRTVECPAWVYVSGTWAGGSMNSISYPLSELGTVIWTLTNIDYDSGGVYMEGSEPVLVVDKWANMRALVKGIISGLVSEG